MCSPFVLRPLARGESAALDPVRLQLSNDVAALTATNDSSKATLKTFQVLSNALVIAWSTNSGEFILSRLAPGVFVTGPTEAFGSLSFTTDGVNSGGDAAYSVDIRAFVTNGVVIGVFDVIGPSWQATHGHFITRLTGT